MSIVRIGVGGHAARPENASGATGLNDAISATSPDHAAEIVHKLRGKLEAYHRRRARRAGWIRRFIPTGLGRLDAVLPHGGLPCGAVTEILADGPGAGSMSLAMRIAYQSTKPVGGGVRARGLEDGGRSIVFIDAPGDFYPPAAWQHGIAFDRLIVIRADNLKDAFWAVDQSLRCPAVAAVIAPLSKLDERLSRRLQLAAKSSGSLGLLLTSTHERGKSFAAVRMRIEGIGQARASTGVAPDGKPVPQADSYLCRITLLTVREGRPTEPFGVDLHHETGAWPVHPVPVDRPAAKTG